MANCKYWQERGGGVDKQAIKEQETLDAGHLSLLQAVQLLAVLLQRLLQRGDGVPQPHNDLLLVLEQGKCLSFSALGAQARESSQQSQGKYRPDVAASQHTTSTPPAQKLVTPKVPAVWGGSIQMTWLKNCNPTGLGGGGLEFLFNG